MTPEKPDELRQPFESDRDLTGAAARGDARARRILVERLLPRVRTTVRYLVSDDPDADDLVQLSLVEIIQAAGSFSGQGRLERWSDRITVRTSMRQLRKKRSRERMVSPKTEPNGLPAAGRDDSYERREMRRHIARLLQTISPKRRIVLIMKLVFQNSTAEIAEITGVPANTVKDRLAKARKQLRKKIVKDPVLRDWVRARNP